MVTTFTMFQASHTSTTMPCKQSNSLSRLKAKFQSGATTFIHTIMETKEFQVKIELSIGQTVYVRRHRPKLGKYEIVKFDGEDRVLVKPLFKTDTSMLNTYAENIIPL